MKKIIISHEIKKKLSDMVLGIIESDVLLIEHNKELWHQIVTIASEIKNSGELSDVSSHPAIKASRKAYKICGKDPARYRLSAEALLRRVVKGMELPQVNNVVDIINLVSIKTGLSIGGYDAEKIDGDIIMDIGKSTDEYEAIGRGDFNIEFIPVLRDNISAFGSPTSDSVRTSVTLSSRKFLMVIFGFSGENDTVQTIKIAAELLKTYAGTKEIETFLIR